jgi:hypothetical protein
MYHKTISINELNKLVSNKSKKKKKKKMNPGTGCINPEHFFLVIIIKLTAN